MFNAQYNVGIIFMFRCVVPKCENLTSSFYDAPFVNFTIPYDNVTKSWNKCQRYQRVNHEGSCSADHYSKNITVDCPEGKVFSKIAYQSTLVTEVNYNALSSDMAKVIIHY